ncbi:MAG: Phosphatidate cytidylyltransferase [Sphingobacteriaceae bacterium]|jgi:phosphatidate cytidylyltransferase|nr:Phosphatidate cytidylyltransferase [Sphingobacteriaceae bacterium]
MKTRAITGFFFVLVMLASVLLGQYTFTVFFLLLSLLCLDEFYRLTKTDAVKPQRFSGILLGIAIFIPTSLHFLFNTDWAYLLVTAPLLTLVFLGELYRTSKTPFHNIGYTLLGIMFAVVPFEFFYSMAFISGEYNFHLPLGFMLLLWASDTGAYLFGVKLGKTKLFERHSPKKTWEGLGGGLFTSLLVAFILSTFYTEIEPVHWAVASLIIVVFGTFGDLTESMLKRSLNAKDSGSLLPGHGGLLDRFDGLLLAAPLVFVYLYFVLRF